MSAVADLAHRNPPHAARHDGPTLPEAVECLRFYFGMAGQPRPDGRAPRSPFERAFAAALAVSDPGTFECLCPMLLVNAWEHHRLLTATAPERRGRLRAAARVALFVSDYSRLGLADAETSRTELLALLPHLEGATMRGDIWDNDPEAAIIPLPGSFWTTHFAELGLRVNWPLADFVKQYTWTMATFHQRQVAGSAA